LGTAAEKLQKNNNLTPENFFPDFLFCQKNLNFLKFFSRIVQSKKITKKNRAIDTNQSILISVDNSNRLITHNWIKKIVKYLS